MPQAFGIAITEISGFPQSGWIIGSHNVPIVWYRVRFLVDQTQICAVTFLSGPEAGILRFDPPIIVPATTTLTIEFSQPNSVDTSLNLPYIQGPQPVVVTDLPELAVGGWTLFPGDL
jgi:hypothetical protein